MFKTALLLLVAAAAFAAGNPARVGGQRWESRIPKITPNTKSLPHYKSLIKSYVPVRSRVPGTHVVENCGQSIVNTERIIGGDEAVPHAYPWQVGLYIDDRYFCGGAIISDEWILTAAHCVYQSNTVEILAGAHDTGVAEDSQVRVMSNNFFTHESYDAAYLINDVALVRMEPISFTSEIGTLCLPSYSDVPLPAGVEVTISGWGAQSDAYPYTTNKLKVATRPTIDNVECHAVYGSTVTDKVICTDTSGGTEGTCFGDSGGPMTAPGTCGSSTCVVSRGIISFVSSAGCESGYPDGYTRTHSFLDWIEANTGIAIGAYTISSNDTTNWTINNIFK